MLARTCKPEHLCRVTGQEFVCQLLIFITLVVAHSKVNRYYNTYNSIYNYNALSKTILGLAVAHNTSDNKIAPPKFLCMECSFGSHVLII